MCRHITLILDSLRLRLTLSKIGLKFQNISVVNIFVWFKWLILQRSKPTYYIYWLISLLYLMWSEYVFFFNSFFCWNFQVSWIRKKDLHILTMGTTLYTNDWRFEPIHPNQTINPTIRAKFGEKSPDWMLNIKDTRVEDTGGLWVPDKHWTKTQQTVSAPGCQ